MPSKMLSSIDTPRVLTRRIWLYSLEYGLAIHGFTFIWHFHLSVKEMAGEIN